MPTDGTCYNLIADSGDCRHYSDDCGTDNADQSSESYTGNHRNNNNAQRRCDCDRDNSHHSCRHANSRWGGSNPGSDDNNDHHTRHKRGGDNHTNGDDHGDGKTGG